MEVFCCSASRWVYNTFLVGQIAGSTHCQEAKAVCVKLLKVTTGTHEQKQNAWLRISSAEVIICTAPV